MKMRMRVRQVMHVHQKDQGSLAIKDGWMADWFGWPNGSRYYQAHDWLSDSCQGRKKAAT